MSAPVSSGFAANTGYDSNTTSVMEAVPSSGLPPAAMVRPPMTSTPDPRITAGSGSATPAAGGRRSPDPSALVLTALGLGALFVVFVLIRGAVNNDSDANETVTEALEVDVEGDEADNAEPNTSVTVPSSDADGAESADGDGGEAVDGEATGDGSTGGESAGDGSAEDDGGGFGFGGGIIDRLRGIDDMINSVNEQIEDLDAKADDVRDIMKRINDAVELAGDAKPEKAAEKLEEAAEKADDNLEGEARDRVFDLIEEVADQLGIEDLDLDQFRDDDNG